MTKRIVTMLLSVAALFQVACGGKKKNAALAAFQQQCNTQACIDMYTNAAKNAGIVGPAAAASLPQVAAIGAPVLPGQVTNTKLLPASVSDTQVAAQQAKITSQLQAIVAAQPTTTTTPTATTNQTAMQPASTGGMSAASVSIGVTRMPASDVAPASAPGEAPAIQLTSSTGAYQPASVDNGSTLGGESIAVGSGAGR